jgi:hypothetical protein
MGPTILAINYVILWLLYLKGKNNRIQTKNVSIINILGTHSIILDNKHDIRDNLQNKSQFLRKI